MFVAFDQPMTATLFKFDIVECESVGVSIVASVNDMGSTNHQLWRYLGITRNQPLFTNPFTALRRVYAFADVPHLVKLLRNHIIDTGFILPDVEVVDCSLFKQLVESDDGKPEILHKLRWSQITCTGQEFVQLVSFYPTALQQHFSTCI